MAAVRLVRGDLAGVSRIGASAAYSVFTLLLLVSAGLKAEILLARGAAHVGMRREDFVDGLAILCEATIAAWLLSGVATAGARRVATLLLLVFVCFSGWRFLTEAEDCGCFGRFKVNPAWTLSLDLVILLILWFVIRIAPIRQGTPPNASRSRVVLAITVTALLPLAVLLASSYVQPSATAGAEIVLLEPSSWKGQAFPLLQEIEGPSAGGLLRGKWNVILANRECHVCRAYLGRLPSTAVGNPVGPTVVIDLAPPESQDPPLPTNSPVLRVRGGRRYIANGPFEIVLNDGMVTDARQLRARVKPQRAHQGRVMLCGQPLSSHFSLSLC